MRKIKINNNFRTFSAAILAGCAVVGFGNTVQAEEIELTSKTLEIPTLDYSNDNYKIEIPTEDLGTLKNIRWTQLDEKPEKDTPNTISVNITDNETLYYKYEYVPQGYEIINEKTDTSFDVTKINNILFQDISTDYYQFGVTYKEQDKPEININADFINNKIENKQEIIGGAIYNTGKIGTISGVFVNNEAKSSAYMYSQVYGSNIYNRGTINNIKSDFINNSGYSYGSVVDGGAIYNGKDGVIENIQGNFINNTINSAYKGTNGGAIYNNNGGIIKNTQGNFINNSVHSSFGSSVNGGAIYNNGTMGNISGNFINNTAYNIDMKGYGGAIYNTATMGNISGNFINNSVKCFEATQGGAIYNSGFIGEKDSEGKVFGGLINSSFIGNYIKADEKTPQGGAIWTNKDLNIIADNDTSTFKGNYVQAGEEKDYQAIWLDEQATLNLISRNGGKIDLYDNINGSEGATVNITGDGSGSFNLYNDIKTTNVQLGNTRLNTINNDIRVYNFNNFALKNNAEMTVDADLENLQMDRITANSYSEISGNINVIGVNLLNDAPDDREYTAIYFAQSDLKNNVTHNGLEVPNHKYQDFTAYTPIYKYNVAYSTDYAEKNSTEDNQLEDGGYFLFTKGDKYFRPSDIDPENPTIPITPGGDTGNPSDAFNPAVLAPSVAAQAGATATMGQVFNYAFQNADNFMNIPYLERISLKNKNKYALAITDGANTGNFSPLYSKPDSANCWVKPYASFENIPLKNGPKVSNITYGTLFGYDTNLIPMKNGWDRVWTGYIGYNGASQRYSGIDSTQNGGLLGGTLTLYKGNFFNATTISTGANVASNQTMYGHEDFTMVLAGIGNKTGYNFEYKEGRLILQPSLLLSYTFVNTFDYTNAAGVKIKSDPLHAIQLAPGLKLIGNLKGGWQPYASVNMVWNLLDKSDVTANEVKLPNMSIKPYVQYGVGVQKRFKDKCMAFGQAMLQNGGRNGISLTAGFRWDLGKDGKPIEKVQGINKTRVSHSELYNVNLRASELRRPVKLPEASESKTVRKVVKQLTPTQKTALIKQNCTTRTTAKAIIKQL